jgi:methylglyoxal synthase
MDGEQRMMKSKQVALVAHDNRKKDLAEWVRWNADKLHQHSLICTGTTGRMIEEVLAEEGSGTKLKGVSRPVTKLRSGPLGGDQQLGAMIAEGRIDIIIFFWDPMEPQPHDVDVKALLRIAVLYNIPVACNRSSADFMISSPLIDEAYQPKLNDYSNYLERDLS